jgi:hypothetical protein
MYLSICSDFFVSYSALLELQPSSLHVRGAAPSFLVFTFTLLNVTVDKTQS